VHFFLIAANRLWEARLFFVLVSKMHYQAFDIVVILLLFDNWVPYLLKTKPIQCGAGLSLFNVTSANNNWKKVAKKIKQKR